MTTTGRIPPGLGQEAASRDAAERWRAAARLADLPGPESEELLVHLLADPDYRVREKSIEALTRRFTPSVAAACAVAIADEENAGRRGSGLTLLIRAGEEGRRVLLGALQHPSPDVRLSAAMSLPGPRAGVETLAALEAAARRESDANVRAALFLAVGRTGRREAIAPLLAVLEEGNLWLRVHALEALGEIGDPLVAPRLLPLLSHPPLRRAVLRTLARLDTSATAEELARRAAAGETDEPLLAALRRAAESSPRETLSRIRALWPGAKTALLAAVEDPNATVDARTHAAHLLAHLDLPGSAASIVRAGPFADGFAALRSLAPERFTEALHAALQDEDPEPALALVDEARESGGTARLAPLLVHPSPSVRAAVLGALPPGAVTLGELLELLAEEDPETALPAAFAIVSTPAGTPLDRARRSALFDRARGSDGPGRAAALLALSGVDGTDIDNVLRGALVAGDPEVRRAAASAAGRRDALDEDDLLPRIADADPAVRAAALRSLAEWAERRGPLRTTWHDLLPGLADDPAPAAAAGAAIVALTTGEDRIRLIGELLAREAPVRRAALEAIPATGDPFAAAAAAVAVGHEDDETARAALEAVVLAGPEVAEPALAAALRDARPSVRQAAAEAVARRPAPGRGEGDEDGSVARALALALAAEEEAPVLEAQLRAVATAGGRTALEPLTGILASERLARGAEAAAEAMARRYPSLVRELWATAPARAERRWARAISRASSNPAGDPDA